MWLNEHKIIKKSILVIALFSLVVGLFFTFFNNKNNFLKISKNQNESRNLASAVIGFCNWGYTGPKVFHCRGKKYIYGTAVCGLKTYNDLFCEDRYYKSGSECEADNSPDTVDCYKKLQQWSF